MRFALLVLLSATGLALADDVQTITITTPPGKMKYDCPLIKAAPGSQLKIVFKNNDAIPYNIVFCRPLQDGTFDKGMEVAMEAWKLAEKARPAGGSRSTRAFSPTPIVSAQQAE